MRTTRKAFSLFLALIMVIGLFPVSAFADEGTIAPADDPVPTGTITITEEEPAAEEQKKPAEGPEEPAEEPQETKDLNVDPSSAEPAQNDTESEVAREAGLKAASAVNVTQETNTVTVTTKELTIAPDSSATIVWNTNTNFTPNKIWIVYSYRDESPQWEPKDGLIVVKKLTNGYSTNWTLSYSDAEATLKAVPWSGYEGCWEVRAYYGFEDDEYVSDTFDVCLLSRNITVTTKELTIAPNSSGTVAWTTNFAPTKIKVVFSYRPSNASFEYTALTAKTLSGSATECTLTYSEAEAILEQCPNVAYDPGWRVYAYYGSGEDDYVSAGVTLELVPRKVTMTNPTVFVFPGNSDIVSWTTNFTQVKAEICYVYQIGFSDLHTYKVRSISGTGTSSSLHYDEVETAYNQIPETYEPVYSHWEIRVYFGSGSEDYVSTSFGVSTTEPAFTTSPSGGTINPGDSLTLSWKTTFIPSKVQIGYWEGGRWHMTDELTSDLHESMSYQMDYENAHPSMSIRAWYNDSKYIESSDINITIVYGFTNQPTGGSVSPGGGLTLSWKTSFKPTSIDIGYYSGGSWVNTVTLTNNMSASMSYLLPYNSAHETMYIRAFYGTGSGEYAESNAISITVVARQFTTQPTGGTVSPGGTLTLRWKTNFVPTGVEILSYVSNRWVVTDTLTSNLSSSMSYPLAYDDAHETMCVRAYYSNGYVDSNYISIDVVARQFTAQPTGGTVYPWKDLPLTWTTNFVPVKVELGYGSETRWTTKVTLTSDFKKNMSYDLAYDEAENSTAWHVKAFYGSRSDDYVFSGAFRVEKLAAYVCGDNLTATLDSSGVLTFDGSGQMYNYSTTNRAPWFDVRSSINRAVFPDGVTYIGTYAFYMCSKMYMVSFTPSVTQVGSNACYDCTALRYVSYDGFPVQWNQITWNYGNARLQDASVSWLVRSDTISGTEIDWELSGYDGSLTISGTNTSTTHHNPPWQAWAEYIAEIYVEDGINTIWDEAFRDCTNVKKVYLPGGLTEVGDGAFVSSTKLTDVYYNGPIEDWNQITIQPYNDPLTGATLHTTAHEEALTGDLSWSVDDTGLLRVWFDDSLMGDGEQTAIPDFTSYTDAPWYADYADKITALRVESGVTSIGRYAFSHLTKLRTIEIADSVTVIGNYSFSYCTRLEDFTLPDSVTRILAYTFQNCTDLEQIHLPDSIQSMGIGVFQNCYNLEKVWLPSQIPNILKNTFYNCSLLDMVSIPATVTSIGDNAFYGCIELASSTGHVYFDGTSAQWAAITVNTDNDNLLNAGHIHFNPEELRIDAVNFPDDQFRAYVANNFDGDHSGWLTDAEIAAADAIDDEDNDYTNLKGIAYFPNLTGILVDAAPSLTSVDLSANTKLNVVDLSGNGNLKEIDLEGLDDLTYLYLSGNALTELDLTGLTDLQYLSVSSNPIKKLDVSDLPLKELYCTNTPLNSLDLSGQTELKILYCYGTHTRILDIKDCPLLVDAYLNGEQSSTTTKDASYVQYKNSTTGAILRIDPDTKVKTEEGTFSNITSSSVDFNGKLYLNTYIKLSDEIMADPDAYVRVTFNGETKDRLVTDLIQTYYDAQGRVKVRLEMFAAMLRDEMTLQVFNGAGEAQPLTYKETTDVTDGFVYTALEYLKGRQEQSTNPYMVELAKAAELYGTAVQVKFDYHTELLTAEDIAAMEAAANAITIPASCAETVTGTLPAGITKRTKTVMFESDNALRQYFYIDGVNIKNYTFTLNGETVKAKKLEAGKYYVQQPNIASALLSTKYSFSVSDGTDTYTIKSSALGYAYDRQENSSDPTMVNLSKLLYRYSQAADAYFGQ